MGKIPVACLVVDAYSLKSCPFRSLKRVQRIFKHPCFGRLRIDLQRRGIIDIRLTLTAADLGTSKNTLEIRKNLQPFQSGFRKVP